MSAGLEIRGKSMRIWINDGTTLIKETLGWKNTPENLERAEKLVNLIQLEIEMGTFDLIRHFPHSKHVERNTIAYYAHEWKQTTEKEVSPSTFYSYGYQVNLHVIPRWGKENPKNIETVNVKKWIRKLKETLHPKTIREIVTRLAQIHAIWRNEHKIAYNPFKDISIQQEDAPEPDPFTKAEISTLLNTTAFPDIENLIPCLLWTGLSISEQLALAWEDIDLEQGTVLIQRGWVRNTYRVTKTRRRKRQIKLLQPVIDALKRQYLITGQYKPKMIDILQRDNQTFKRERLSFVWVNHETMMHYKANEDSDNVDPQDKILSAMLARKMKGNASYFAFTATPKNTTLEKFGEKQVDGSFKPFDLYSMKQAIEEGFILDVLSNYTTYKSFYEIEKSILDNPLFDTKKAQKTLRSYVEKTQQTIDIKAEVMLDHFIQHVVNTKKLKGKAKGMIVTQNIESAIRYYKAIDRLLEQAGYPFKAIIAFSGEKKVDGIEYSEAILNRFSDNDTKDMFDRGYVGDKKPVGVNEDQYRLLIVANKYLTGFDQPKLCTMYVDKKLADVLCVQALSRLNRSAPKLGKRTEDLFVLDFFNEIEDIKQSFDRFYTSTTLSQATDINVLNELKGELDTVGVYESSEVKEFATKYFDSVDAEELSPIIDTAVTRFDAELELSAEDKADFKIKAKQFVKIYGQMASILPYEVPAWEKLYWFLKFLIPKLKIEDPEADALDELLNSVDLNSYGLQRKKLNEQIELDAEETILDPTNPNPRGAHGSETEEDPLDEIIKTFNERWFGGWAATPEEQKVKFVNILKQIKEHADFEGKYLNNPDPHTKDLAFDKIMNEVMLRQRKIDMDMYKHFSKDSAFRMSWKYSLQQGVMR